MILYNPTNSMGFHEYGIKIPIAHDKAKNTFERLKQHPKLGKNIEAWHTTYNTQLLTQDDLRLVHSIEYVNNLYSEQKERMIMQALELVDAEGNYNRYDPDSAQKPLSEVFDKIMTLAGGTWLCSSMALKTGFCYHFGGGMHHAHFDFGHGFCLVNDIVIAIRKLQAENKITTAWIIDVDAHKGDGTAELTRGDQYVTALSIHMKNGWPMDGPQYDKNDKLNPAFVPSQIDIAIDENEEFYYLPRLKAGLEALYRFPKPDLAIVVSGVDPYAGDELPSTKLLNLSLEQMFERDKLVYKFLLKHNIPSAYLMAGGYGQESYKVYARFLEWVLPQRLL